jgi:PAS domain S-box-containing protein
MSAFPLHSYLSPESNLSEKVIECSLDGIVVFDREGRVLVWNPAMERISGLSRSNAVGQNVLELLPFLNEISADRHFEAVLAGQSGVINRLPYSFSASGRDGFAEARYSPVRDTGGSVIGGMTIIRDISARKRTHDRLWESEHRFRSLFEEAPIAYHEIDKEGIVRRVNHAECELFGLKPEQIINRPVWDLVAPDQREESRFAVQRKLSGQQPLQPFRRDCIRPDGVRLTLEVHDRVIRDGSGRVEGIRSAMLDHTEKARTEQELNQTRRDLELRVRDRTAELAQANQSLQMEVAERRRVEQRLAMQYEVSRILAESSGVTAAAPRILQAICENQSWNRGVFWTLNAASRLLDRRAVWSLEPDHDWNGQPTEAESGLAGWVLATREPAWVEDVNHADDFPWSSLRRHNVRGGLVFPVMIGEQVAAVLAFFSRKSQPVDEDLLRATALLGRQIGQFMERRRAEEALEQSEARFTRFMQHLPGVAFMKDMDGRYVYHSARHDVAGFEGSTTVGRTDEELFPGLAATYRANDRLAFEMGAPIEVEEPVLMHGQTHQWLLYKFPIPDRTGRTAFIGGVGIDITERRQLEEQLRQSQKMEAIGRLAGGVAHDFNNLLTIISGYGRMVLDDLPTRSRLRGRVEEVLNAADRAAILTSQLLAFSRRQVVQPRVLELNHLISNLEKMLRRVIGEYIELRTVLPADLGKVKVDSGQMEQVIMNLSVNARDAMPEGGVLMITTSNAILRKETDPPDAPPQRYVKLSVCDTGVGMDANTRNHLFEPFFTTKDRGKGTGLGLSTVYGIVRQNGGDIRVESSPGAGTTFDIYLPSVDEVAAPAATVHTLQPAAKGTETVLLVEDEMGVRQLARQILKQYGYRVLVAADAKEAIRLTQQERGPIHLLLTDVIMPLMSGRELVEQLKQALPDLRVIYMSGYTDDVLAYRGDLGSDINFLQKPFAPEALTKIVREVLER